MSDSGEKKKSGFGAGVLTGISISLVTALIICSMVAVWQKSREGLVTDRVEKKIDFIEGKLDQYYYEDVSDEDKIEGLYRGLMESTGDRYTSYYSPKEYEDYKIETTGNLSGIGATLQKDKTTEEVSVVRVYEDSPAEKAGLQAEDVLVSADGQKSADMTLDEFVSIVRGEAGTTVDLVYRRGDAEQKVTVTRENIQIPSVSWKMLDNGIGYVDIYEFSSGTLEEYKEAMEDLTEQGMKAVIFDLRFNGGGFVDSVTDILDLILPKGTVVYLKDKHEKRIDYTSDEERKIDMPIAVLVSGNTASAAEIFTGAIKDFKYGTIIGTKTYGKGIVQSTFPLTDGSALKITTETYYTPSGAAIHGVGIEPDIELPFEFLGEEDDDYEESLDNQIQKACEVLTEEMK